MDDFKSLQTFVDEMKATSSSNKKKVILSKYKDNAFIIKVLKYTNDDSKTYGVTSDNVKKNTQIAGGSGNDCLFQLLDRLSNRKITGHKAILEVKQFIFNHILYDQLIYDILDKDIETRANASLINKVIPGLIPEFKVALANKYVSGMINVDSGEWYGSRKLDGVRCIIKIENGIVEFYSRTGKRFYTLGVLEENLSGLGNMVLDGEVCIVKNGVEDFQSVMKEIRKKDHTIENPKFFMFDCLTIEEFNSKKSSSTLMERLNNSPRFSSGKSKIKNVEILEQTKITSLDELTKLVENATKRGYEGVMLRKNVGYEGKRTNNLLKVKTFMDAEYIVENIIMDNMRFLEDGQDIERETLASVIIEHKNNKVKVGSGFSKEQREFYYKYPDEILGKTITVQYFEETKNQEGGISLRFPTIKCVHGKERVL